MHLDLDVPYLRQLELPVFYCKSRFLRIGDAVGAPLTFKAGIAWFAVILFDSTEEAVKGPLYPEQYVLQNL